MKGKKQTCQLLMTQTGKAMKKIVLRQEASRIVGTGRFYIKLFMSICTREHSSNPTLVSLFFPGSSLSLLPDTVYISGSCFFLFNMETKLQQRISQNTGVKFLYCAYCHTNVWSHLIWFHYFIILYHIVMQTLHKK